MEKHFANLKSKSNLLLIMTLFLALSSLGSGCSEDMGVMKENKPPTVWLSSAPPEGSLTQYSIHLFWGGWDPDGEIQYYEYAITDNETGVFEPADTTGRDKWHKVFSNDSIFTFTADLVADSNQVRPPMQSIYFTRSHTFLIRAVDEQGLASIRPSYRSFTARTLSPIVQIRIPVYTGFNPALVPPITRFSWEATDYVDDFLSSQEPDSVRWILLDVELFNDSYSAALQYIRQNPDAEEWHPWQYYKAPDDTGKFWMTPPLDLGPYMFAVQVKDEAGAVSPVFDEERNVRRIVVSKRSRGPLLTVRNQYIGALLSQLATTTFTIVDLPAGVPVWFEWEATADSYGGIVAGYRYGWDIVDLSKDDQWAIDWTPFVRTTAQSSPEEGIYYYGTHTFHVEVIDNSGFISRVGIKINFVPFTMERNLLLIDDYYEDPNLSGWARTNGALPSDAEHDAFWLNALKFLDDFDPTEGSGDVISVAHNRPLLISKLARYKSIIWDAYAGYSLHDAKQPFLHDVIGFISEDPDFSSIGKVQPNLIALFMAAGGHVLICGDQPMTASFHNQYQAGLRFPFILQYEFLGDQDGDYDLQLDNPVGDQAFPFRDMCIDVLDIAYTSYSALRRPGGDENGCGVTHVRGVRPKEDGLREALPVDPRFSLLTLRPEAGDDYKFYGPQTRGLNDELYNPPYFSCGLVNIGPRPCIETIYEHGCLDTFSPLYGAPAAIWTSVYADIVPEAGGIAARSSVWGFEPAYFDTTQVREALEVILFNEWQLPKIRR